MLNALTRKSKSKSKALAEVAEATGTKDADSTVKTPNNDLGTDKAPPPPSSSSPASSGGSGTGAVCRVKHKKSHKDAGFSHPEAEAATAAAAAAAAAAARARSASSRRSCSTVVTFESIQPTQVWQASASPSPPASLKGGDLSKYRRGKKAGTSSCAGSESLTLSMIARAAECQWISGESTGDEEDVISDDWGAGKSNSRRRHHQHPASPSCRRPATASAVMTKSGGSLSASSDSSPTTSTSSFSSLEMVGRSGEKSSQQSANFGPSSSSSSSKRCAKYSERGAGGGGGSSYHRKHRRSPVLSSSSSSSSSSSLSDPDNDFSWMARALKLEASTGGSLGSATPIQTPQLKRTSINSGSGSSYAAATKTLSHVPPGTQISSAQQTPQLSRLPLMQLNPASTASPIHGSSFSRPQVLSVTGLPKGQRCPTEQVPLVRRPLPKMEFFSNPLALVTESFFPTTEWMQKYKVITARQGDYLRIIPYPGTNPDLSTAPTASLNTSGWLLAQKWCSDHRTGTGPIGFVPRSICRLPSDHVRRAPVQEAMVRLSPRHISQDAVSHHSDCGTFMTTSQQFRSNLSCAIVSESVSMSEHLQLRVYPSPASVAAETGVDPNAQQAGKTVFGSGASIAGAAYEIEDRDSGRGPSSGSEWSSGKGGSLSGATDLNADEKIDQPPISSTGPSTSSLVCSSPSYQPQHWGVRSPVSEPHERRASLDQSIYGGFTGLLPPPPMVLLSDAVATSGTQKTESGLLSPNASQVSSMSDTESPWSTTVKSKLYVRPLRMGQSLQDSTGPLGEQVSKPGSQTASRTTAEEEDEEGNGSPPTVVVPSNSDPTYWEPYKTMIQVGQNKLEKFTLV